MEAAGVEPASERPVATEIYVCIRAFVFTAGLKTRPNNRRLVRLSLAPPHRTDGGASLLKWHSLPAHRLTRVNVAGF